MRYLFSFFLISLNYISCEPDFVNINSREIDYYLPTAKLYATTSLIGLLHKRAKQEEELIKLTDLSETGNSEIDNNDIHKPTKQSSMVNVITEDHNTENESESETPVTISSRKENTTLHADWKLYQTPDGNKDLASSAVKTLAFKYFINKDKTTIRQVQFEPSIQYFNILRDGYAKQTVTKKYDSFEKQLQKEKENFEALKQLISGSHKLSTSAYTESYNNTDLEEEYSEKEKIEESSEKESDRKEMLYDKIFLFGDINNKSHTLDHSDTYDSNEYSDVVDNLIERIKRIDTKINNNKPILRSIETHDSTEFELENSVTKIRDISKEFYTTPLLETSKTPPSYSSETTMNHKEKRPIKVKLTTSNLFNNPYLNAKVDRADPMIMKSIYKYNTNTNDNNIKPEWKKLHYDSSYSDDDVDLLKENIDKAFKAVVKKRTISQQPRLFSSIVKEDFRTF